MQYYSNRRIMFKIKMRVTGGTKYWTLNNQISFVTELTLVVSVSVLLWFSPQAHHTSKQFLWTLSWQIHIWYIAYPQLRYPALGVLETAVRIVPTSKAWNDSKIRSTAWGSFASAQFSSIVIHSFYYHLSIWTAEKYISEDSSKSLVWASLYKLQRNTIKSI